MSDPTDLHILAVIAFGLSAWLVVIVLRVRRSLKRLERLFGEEKWPFR